MAFKKNLFSGLVVLFLFGISGATGSTAVSETELCSKATTSSSSYGRVWVASDGRHGKFVEEALNRGYHCNVYVNMPDEVVCKYFQVSQKNSKAHSTDKKKWLFEIERRSLDCSTQSATAGNVNRFPHLEKSGLCNFATRQGRWETQSTYLPFVKEAKRRGLNCGVGETGSSRIASGDASNENQNLAARLTDSNVCRFAVRLGFWDTRPEYSSYVAQAKRRGLTCGVNESGSVQTAAVPKSSVSSAELTAAQKEAQRLREELAALKANQEEQQRTIAADKQVPLITITKSGTDQRKGIIRGFARDNVQIAEVLIDGNAVSVGSDGSFEWSGFVPATGKDIIIEAIDTAALSSRQVVSLERDQTQQAAILTFDDLDPMAGRKVQENKNALALIIGIANYDRTQAPAVFADKDAQFFHDYASLKLGITENNITTLVNGDAEQVDVLLSVKNWLSRAVKQNKSDVYVFFAGHGLASDDGEKMYLLPYDGAPELLDRTAILRDELFTDIAAANPRSVTVFLDTCYSGTTRGPDMLIASRPIAIRAKESAIPEGFTVMTAAAGDQTAKPLEEARHGMFSYFLMKGMEGDADVNQDNQITAGELHAYVQQNVIQQSSGSQTPELQGDAGRVLVRFQ